MLDLSYHANQGKFLVTDREDPIYGKVLSAPSDILENNGFKACDLSYRKHVKLSREDLVSKFEPVPSQVLLSYTDDAFSSFHNYWYNEENDFYIQIASSPDLDYEEEEDDDDLVFEDDELIEENAGSYRIIVVWYKPEDTKKIQNNLNEIAIFNPPTDNKIHLVIQTNAGFEFKDFSLNVPLVDIDTMYNDDFAPVYEHIVDKLSTGNKGVVLLYGAPGTGKTNLIKSLTSKVKKGFIFIPIGMIDVLASPIFIGELIKHKGSILVIEDCENYIEDRKLNKSSVVSTILQITDGLLSDVMDIKVICTFNTDLTQIDPALMREGRMIAEYEFKPLAADKTSALTDGKITTASSLATIFNTLTLKPKEKKTNKIGFGN